MIVEIALFLIVAAAGASALMAFFQSGGAS
jgi:hypothetical protein